MILYTSPTRIKRDTPLGASVDEHLLTNYIRLAQDKEILPMLGTQLDAKLKSDIEADTLTGEYATLVNDYIVPALVQFAFAMFAPTLRVRFSNNSVTVISNDQGNPANYSDIKPMIDHAQNMGEFYRERGILYILNDTSSFPEYNENTGSDLHPSTNSYGGTLNIGRGTNDVGLKNLLSSYGFKKFI